MTLNKQQLIADIGTTDQLFLQHNTAELALQRGRLRLQLVLLSKQAQERVYFLQQAIAILEQALLIFDEIELALYLELSIALAECYLTYYHFTQQQHFALIVQQILKPLAHHQHLTIYQFLQQSAEAQQQSAMAKHWHNKAEQLIQKQQFTTQTSLPS